MQKITSTLSFILFFYTSVFCQKYTVSKSELAVYGTSTIHDWHMKSYTSTGLISIEEENKIVKSIKNLEINLSVKTLKSGKKDLDENAYKVLKANTFTAIKFELTEILSIQNLDNKYLVKMKGNLTICGVKKNIIIESTLKKEGKTVKLEGEFAVKFTDFKIDPPKLFLGALKTGNDLQIKYVVYFEN